MIKLLKINGLLAALFTMVLALTPECRAQEVFEDPEGKYTVTLPTGWLGIVNQDALGRNDVNIVFKVRENGALKVRRMENTNPNVEVLEYASKDEADRVRFAPGYTKIRMEKFLISAGKYGALLSYDYQTTSAQPFTGRVYYVRTDDGTVYILQFTGRRSTLGSLRNQTDLIARSFKSK
ncbi:MAG: hypothetical protein ACK562_13885 [Acidobacteriota bacterium]|jgi:hypothetical protein